MEILKGDTATQASWVDNKNCSLDQANLFFVGKGESSAPARAICDQCVVVEECLQYALDAHERLGVWGSTSERERRRIRGLGITAAEYIQGKAAGIYKTPKQGRPAR